MDHVNFVAHQEDVDTQTITAYILQLVSNDCYDRDTANISKEIVAKGTFSNSFREFTLSKTAFLMDLMEIGRRKSQNSVIYVILLNNSHYRHISMLQSFAQIYHLLMR